MTDSSPASFEDLVTYARALESLDRVSFKLKSQQLDSIKYVVEGRCDDLDLVMCLCGCLLVLENRFALCV